MLTAMLLSMPSAALASYGDDGWWGYGHYGFTYQVTITNLTQGQIFSPPIVVSHDDDIALFTPGESASTELAQVAEDAFNDPLVALLGTSHDVYDVNVGTDVIPPGTSLSVEIRTSGHFRLLSLVGMMVTTNDTFYAINSIPTYWGTSGSTYAYGWDAGSEGDSEDCDHIPGPPCGNAFEPSNVDAEGFVYIDSGIHGIGDLDPSISDWRNPVALVRIERTW